MEKFRTWQSNGKNTLSVFKPVIWPSLVFLLVCLFPPRFVSLTVGALVFVSLGPLVSKVKEYQVETIVDTLCTNMLSDKEQLRDISSIGLKTVIGELPPASSGKNTTNTTATYRILPGFTTHTCIMSCTDVHTSLPLVNLIINLILLVLLLLWPQLPFRGKYLSCLCLSGSALAASVCKKITGRLTSAIAKQEDVSVQLEALDIMADMLCRYAACLLHPYIQ